MSKNKDTKKEEAPDLSKPLSGGENSKITRFNEDTRDPSFLEFFVNWEDERDIYKQNSPSALKKLGEQPWRTELSRDDAVMMACIGADLDRTLSMEDIIGAPKKPHIPTDIQEQIDRLPSWLRSMVIMKYSRIQAEYKDNSYKLFRAIANRIDKYRIRLSASANDDIFSSRDDGGEQGNSRQVVNKLNDDEGGPKGGGRASSYLTDSAIAIRVAYQGGRWKNKGEKGEEIWPPIDVTRANLKLRAALQTRAAYVDLASVAEDEEMLAVEERVVDSDEDDNGMMSSKNYWQNIFDAKAATLTSEKKVEKDLTHHRKLTKSEKARLHQKKAQEKLSKFVKHRVAGLIRHIGQQGQAHLFVSKQGKRRKKRIILTRGYFRDPERIFHHQCGGFQNTPIRLARSYRWDDTFHSYCVALVSWFWFRALVMVFIAVNAISLAVESGELGNKYAFWFEVMDNIFVAIYTVEFLLKFYAHPYRYWRSGFNIFDFIILTISITKSVIDWTNLADVDALRTLLIVRALRILRGISLSVQLQVLVSALMETIKTHVLSVVILLVLLLYVTAIVAFYFFGLKNPESFGTIGRGMLNMLRVLTIDGWTDLNFDLQKRSGSGATIFIITCIVLGNFLFSNIFVAIIIMNISEATDNFREKQKEKRDTVVRLKKEKVFRRQKLDLRQLFSKQTGSAFTDFFSICGQFQKLLRHDDLVAVTDVVTSPLWMDSVYQTMLRSDQTGNVIMNLHREIADNMLELFRMYREGKIYYAPIKRGRYNRYLRMKAKLSLIKREILKMREDKGEPRIRIKLPKD